MRNYRRGVFINRARSRAVSVATTSSVVNHVDDLTLDREMSPIPVTPDQPIRVLDYHDPGASDSSLTQYSVSRRRSHHRKSLSDPWLECIPPFVTDDTSAQRVEQLRRAGITDSEIRVYYPWAVRRVASSTETSDSEHHRRHHALPLDDPWIDSVPPRNGRMSRMDRVIQLLDANIPEPSIMRVYPWAYNAMHRSIHVLTEDMRRQRAQAERTVDVYLCYGPTATGKSTWAVKKAVELSGRSDRMGFYILDKVGGDNGPVWFNGYVDQEVLLIDEYGGADYHITLMLKWFNGLVPCALAVKGGVAYALWHTVIITTNIPMSQWMNPGNRPIAYEHMQAFARRIHHVYHFADALHPGTYTVEKGT